MFGISLDKQEFINNMFMEYTKEIFSNVFYDEIHLNEEKYSNDVAGMGYFKLFYYLPSKDYEIVFEYERLLFTIKIKNNENFSNFFVNHKDIKNSLEISNIKTAVLVLKEDIMNDNFDFFKITKNRKLKKRGET
ncbi:hypothetical protein [Carnobacterium maltaromaticum]|uniref:hypothetical protein n=1 Tax=Carnobacterium maltaromaticum TaxID=2751 RepID=UPI00295E9EE6|nr:hypothetical protein [Carnobacterium maltaromaticum]